MLIKSRGIVLRFTKYGDTSLIATIFTEKVGLQSYMIKGARSSKSKIKMALLQPLTILDMVAYHREQAQTQHIREMKCDYIFKNLPQDQTKKTIAFFIAEILNRAVKDQSHPEELFRFIENTLIALDESESKTENFHLEFLIGLSRQLGFGPGRWNEITLGRIIPQEDANILQDLIDSKKLLAPITTEQRRALLNIMLDFYQHHLDNFGKIKSVEVLREILS